MQNLGFVYESYMFLILKNCLVWVTDDPKDQAILLIAQISHL